jgi:hypothetical protein
MTPSLSHITAMWAPPVSFIPFPTPADLSHATTSPRCLRPPCAARPPASRCQSKSLVPRLDSPFQSPPLNPSLSCPTFNGVKAITASRFPLPRPDVPLPGPYKRRAPPLGFTGPLPASLLFAPKHHPHQAPPPPVIPHRRPTISVPPPPPLVASEDHRHSLPFFLNRGEVPRTGASFRPSSG